MIQTTLMLLGHVESESSMENLGFFLVAYLLLWALIFGYLYYLHGRVKELETDLDNQVRDPLAANAKKEGVDDEEE